MPTDFNYHEERNKLLALAGEGTKIGKVTGAECLLLTALILIADELHKINERMARQILDKVTEGPRSL